MAESTRRAFPCYIFAVLSVLALVASGLYLGMMRIEGATTGHVLRAAGYGILGLLMIWGAVGTRR
jgi:hypothetical protein